jgi:hypothetical protein
MQRDINNFDYLSVSVKSEQLDRIMHCYRSLGWSEVKREDDRQYYDMKYVLLSRPHKIRNKDRLQYLQVKMETKINAISQIRVKRHIGSTCVTIGLCVFMFLFALSGILAYFLLSGTMATVSCFALCSCAFACLLFEFFPFLIMRKSEVKKCNGAIKNNLRAIDGYIAEARTLCDSEESEYELKLLEENLYVDEV